MPEAPEDVGISLDTAISEQYREVEEAVAEVVPQAPAPSPEPVAAPPEPAPAPPPEDQYHSETPPDVSVKQDQPSNVNVSIRINSPGDDGPVVQINQAGVQNVVDQVVEAVRRQTPPAQSSPEPAPPAGPENWEWDWTSACFGAPRAAAAQSWKWRWSCDEQAGVPIAVPELPDTWPLAEDPVAAVAPLFAPVAAPEPQRRARANQVPRWPLAAPSPPVAQPPPPAAGTPSAVGPAIVAAAADVSARAGKQVAHAVRAAARARPVEPGTLLFPSGGSGHAAGAAGALGAVSSLLLGIWLAVLTTAIGLAIPRIRRRQWSGPAWRLTRLSSQRLERPG